MKRNILLWLCLYASLCQAQEVSLRVADSWVSLKMEEMQTEIKPGWSIAGKKLKDTRVLYLWGKSSRQVTDDRKPVLKVEPGERETLVDYALIQLKGNAQQLAACSIVALDVNTNEVQKLTDDSVIATYPSASADGSRIAFSTPTGEIYVINLSK